MSEFQTASAIDDIANITVDKERSTNLIIQWSIASVSSDAELAALRHLTEQKRIGERQPSKRSQVAFRTILDFQGAEKTFENLFDDFPHLESPWKREHRLKPTLLKKFASFNTDHRAAYESLRSIPNGLMFINGCPGMLETCVHQSDITNLTVSGAGKTEFNMVLAALIQSRRDRENNRHSPVLFLVDINKTVDDAANRYLRLCKEVGLKLRIVRMHGFPYEMRNSCKIQQASSKADGASNTTVDFTRRFLTTASLASEARLTPSDDRAPTLDEAAWQYFESHKHAEIFASLQKLLNKMRTEGALPSDDWKALRSRVKTLYTAVLAQADFIATTPVAASGHFANLFRPKVIFIDEAPHARELTTLIPVAYFDPKVWIFTGDVKQTEPFVKGGSKHDMERNGLKLNPHTSQLKLSTMARAARVGALNAQLLVNNRAYGNLHRLPSLLFYEGQMKSGYEAANAMYPRSTEYLRNYLSQVSGFPYRLEENRIIVHLASGSEKRHRSSFWNPCHHDWVLAQTKMLLQNGEFESLRPSKQGTVMIATPYKSAARKYQEAIKHWPQEWKDRLEVLTVDKSQGNQADVVILDMVRTETVGFMDNPQRLNVAITRARQAEIIVMNPKMTTRPSGQETTYTSQLWKDTSFHNRIFEPEGPHA